MTAEPCGPLTQQSPSNRREVRIGYRRIWAVAGGLYAVATEGALTID
jgi:hypothetical protein